MGIVLMVVLVRIRLIRQLVQTVFYVKTILVQLTFNNSDDCIGENQTHTPTGTNSVL